MTLDEFLLLLGISPDILTIVVRLGLSLILGASIGFERELAGRAAGFRTHILLSLAATLAMMLSMYGFDGGDPARLATATITGVGFIGAGAIMRDGGNIKGITTAATLWITTIIGLSIGNGYYVPAIITTLLALITLTSLRTIERALFPKRTNNSTKDDN